jgi:hypothetical protein
LLPSKLAAQTTEKVEIQVDPALKNLVDTTFTTLDGETLKNTAEIFQLEFSSPNSKAKTFEEQELFIKLVEASLK